ncbi:DNA cytosine methyltransferase [Azotobacter beijerinckii]|uniref:DNA (cytosine-5-)-methyltransferase n=1 Tax=Azotobacter beijerinckii TaxID=170623 RepID=A0A1I4HQQ7_9GAMM|nr:DNA cytosine methyltransferase [Azotobacter beijerinckii]SFB64716.1 DNA (cytosine-5)-methyltransferase 1 [Azotobacter beijerinckii]SFL44093.1 DNA (cytosine-5)-methyltransferase 1 [Azotobacter beijerinckii]
MTFLKNLAPLDFRTQYALPLNEQDEEINVDLFAGGGGASTGLEMGLERPVHIAINHNPAAISMHQANHPGALHLQTDVWDVDPVQVLAGRKIGWFHASPDCTHHSQAAGGQPRKKEIRDLSWVVIKWAGIAQPRIISLENVKQIRQWGPLIAKRCKKTGRVMRLDGTVAEPGERVPREQQFLVPDPKRKGSTWWRFLAQLEGLGYVVEHRVLRACDYGAPTSRERLFLVARRDGEHIVWPEPTHAEKPAKGQKPYRTAAECIDWNIPSQSIFNRKKPLAEATLRRIAKGVKREVLDRAKPFIVPIANWSRDAVQPTDQPLNTVTAWPRGGSFALALPQLVKFRFDEGGLPMDKPLPTITSGGNYKRPAGAAHAMGIATTFLAQANGGFNTTHSRGLDQPMTTVTNTGSQQQLVTANLVTLRKNCAGRGMDEQVPTLTAGAEHQALVTSHLTAMAQNVSSIDPEQPLPTVLAGAARFGVVECKLSPEVEAGALRSAAFLVNYYGNGDARQLEQPLDTITTRDRLALVTVWIGGDPYLIVDICLRMLQPHELYAAQGFPPNYIITHGHDGRRFTKSEQVHMCGNSVSPPPMAAIARANDPWRRINQEAIAA